MTFIPRDWFLKNQKARAITDITVHSGLFTKGHEFVVTDSYNNGKKVNLIDENGVKAYGISSYLLEKIR